jgi:hypothetical protein
MKRARFARAGAALTMVAMGAGCNLLLDLDGYRNALPQDAGSQPPFDAGPEVTPPPPPPPDATPDVFDPIPESVLAARWARFPMVDKPVGAAGTKYWVDSATNISWRDTKFSTSDPASVPTACEPNERLPTRIELVSFLDSVNRKFGAPGVRDGLYWSASAVFPRSKPERFWLVSNDGTVKPSDPQGATDYRVLCVLGKEAK